MSLGSPAGFDDLASFSGQRAFVFAKWKNGLEGPGTRVGENSLSCWRGGREGTTVV